MSSRVLFVCTGNICRSPFAELLARHMVNTPSQDRQPNTPQFASAGIAGLEGSPMEAHMAAELEARSVSPDPFRARRLTSEIAHEADLLLVMAAEHRLYILEEWPDLVRRTWLLRQAARVAPGLAHMGPADLVSVQRANPAPPMSSDTIPDPYGQGPAAAARAAARIETALQQVLAV